MKKIIFAVIIVLLAVAGAAHTAWCYFRVLSDTFTSFPADVAFFLIIPYAAAIAVCSLVGAIVCRKR